MVMASVEVRFAGLLRIWLGTEATVVDADTVGDALLAVENTYGEELRRVFGKPNLPPGIRTSLDGKDVTRNRQKSLCDGDTVHMLAAMQGG